MRMTKVRLKERSYAIIIGSQILKNLGSYIRKTDIGEDAYCISNAAIKSKYGNLLERALKKSGLSVRFALVADSEKSKSIQTAADILTDITGYDKKRSIFIVAFGGGVIGDLSGFVASIYKRGIPYIQVPTTLLAQVDSAIGGKTALDLARGKNLVGAFYQPRLVFSDVALLKSLDSRQMRSGLSEAIKYGIIKDRVLFDFLERRYKDILFGRQEALAYVVGRCSEIKAKIVSADERETKGLRTILNFGHTIGHAIEAASGYKGYNHAEAIALGMLVAAELSRRKGFIGGELVERIEVLISRVGLPTKIRKVPLAGIITAHYHDKKFVGKQNRFVLIKGIAKTAIVKNLPLAMIKGALESRM